MTNHSLGQCLMAFLEDRRSCHYSTGTLRGMRKDITVFTDWAWRQQRLTPAQLTPDLLQAYQQYLVNYQSRRGRPLAVATRKTYLVRLQAFLGWLFRLGQLNQPLSDYLILPTLNKTLPPVLSITEMERLLAAADVHQRYGVRDRAILETLYSTGMRSLELAHLTLPDLALDTGWILIRQGKDKKDRRIPVGEQAVDWLQQYLHDERPRNRGAKQHPTVFLTPRGQPFLGKGISALVARYLRRTGLRNQGGSHLIRHTMATHMLQGGADIRYIQQMLGHSDLSCTQIYTQVLDPVLKQVHNRTHSNPLAGS